MTHFCVSTDRTLAFVTDFIVTRGYAPSMREVRDGVGLSSTSVAVYHLRKLKAAGRVAYEPRKPRTLRVVGL